MRYGPFNTLLLAFPRTPMTAEDACHRTLRVAYLGAIQLKHGTDGKAEAWLQPSYRSYQCLALGETPVEALIHLLRHHQPANDQAKPIIAEALARLNSL